MKERIILYLGIVFLIFALVYGIYTINKRIENVVYRIQYPQIRTERKDKNIMRLVVIIEDDYEGEFFKGLFRIPNGMDIKQEEDAYRNSDKYRSIGFVEWLIRHGAERVEEDIEEKKRIALKMADDMDRSAKELIKAFKICDEMFKEFKKEIGILKYGRSRKNTRISQQ